MKKLLLSCTVFLFTAANLHAQDQEKPKVELSKEKKAELKKIKEENITASFTEIGLKEEDAKRARGIIADAMQKSNELKADNTLTEEDKKAKKEIINDEKNTKLKELLGDKYKEWQAIRKKHKAAEEEFVANAAKKG
jgi:hypothetical protein